MKLHFEPNLDYQLAAIEAVCDLFRGQEICRGDLTVIRDPEDAQRRLGFAENDLGIGNRLTLLDDDLLKNLNAVQLRNGLPPFGLASLGGFHRRDGDGDRQDLRLLADGLRVTSGT
jgi:type III restriction enzyme